MEVNKYPFAKSCLAGAIAVALLTGCGGGGGGGGKKDSDASSPSAATVSGAAVKGIIKNGVVKLYGVDGNGVRGLTPLAEGRTSSEDGSYSLQVTGYNGPVIVEISALASTDEGYPSLMVCDIPGEASCVDEDGTENDVGFGQDYPLGETFRLKAVVPQVSGSGTVTANVSALTDLAASLAEDTGVTADSVNIANSQVANLFGLTGSITTLPVVDVTDTEALGAVENESALKAALLSASLLAAAKADGSTIEGAVAAVATSFVANDGQLVNNEAGGTTTTLAEILAQAETLIADELADIDSDVLDQLSTNITNEQSTAETAASGSTTTAEPSEDNLSSGFLKAKGLIQDLRDISTAATFDDIREGSTVFADNLKAAGDLVNKDTGRAFEALSRVASAIAEAAQEEAEGDTYTAENGILVAVGTDGGETTYRHTGQVTVSDDEGEHTFDVTLTGAGVFSVIENNEDVYSENDTVLNGNGTTSITADFSIVGSVSNSVVQLDVLEGSQVVVAGFNEEWEDELNFAEDTETESEVISIDQIGFNLNVELTQKTGDSPVSFAGALEFDIRGYASDWEYEDQNYSCEVVDGLEQCSFLYTDSSMQDFDTLSLSLSGNFARGEESFGAALTVNATNNGYQLQDSSAWSHFWREGEDSQYNYEESSSEETENAFVRVNFTLDMDAKLDGISDDVAVRLTGNRSAFRTGAASLRLQYEGKTIDANLALTGASNARAAALTITNNQGAVLTISEANIDDETETLQGVITADGAQQATVAEENDIVIIRYNGGYIESF